MVLPASHTSGTLKLSDISTILSVDELAKNVETVSDNWHKSFYMTSKVQAKVEPKCCCMALLPVTIFCATTAGIMALMFTGLMLYRIISALTADGIVSSHLKFSGVLAVGTLMYAAFAGLLIIGVVRRRHRYMLPMIVITICLTVASIGTLIAVTINVFENIREEVQERKTETTALFMRIVVFRLILIITISAKIVFTVCYLRCYRYLLKAAKMQTPFLGITSLSS